MVKISGDGARFSKSSSYVLWSFSFPALASNTLAASGMLYGFVYHVIHIDLLTIQATIHLLCLKDRSPMSISPRAFTHFSKILIL